MTALLSDPVDIAVVDYGMGNRRSVEKALERVGASACVTSDAGRLRAAAGLVVPGVGSFPRAMANLRELRLDELLLERVAGGTPVLGVCLGMQLAFERSSEHGGGEGLGLVAGEVRELRAGSLKLPHIGWYEVRLSSAGSELVTGLPEDDGGVLGGVVGAGLQVAVDRHIQVHVPVAGEQVEHVVEEADARIARSAPVAVEGQREAHLRLARAALHRGRSRRHGASRLSPMRASIERACHSSPSTRAIGAPARASLAAASGPMWSSAIRRRKWRAESIEAKRAAPAVGRT